MLNYPVLLRKVPTWHGVRLEFIAFSSKAALATRGVANDVPLELHGGGGIPMLSAIGPPCWRCWESGSGTGRQLAAAWCAH